MGKEGKGLMCGVDWVDVGKLLTLLRAFPPEEPTKKRFIGDMIAWSSKFGEFPAGDPELHHVAGTVYAEGKPTRCRLRGL